MASEKFSYGAVSSSRQTIKFSRNSDGEMDGSSSDEESSKTIKVIVGGMSVTLTDFVQSCPPVASTFAIP